MPLLVLLTSQTRRFILPLVGRKLDGNEDRTRSFHIQDNKFYGVRLQCTGQFQATAVASFFFRFRRSEILSVADPVAVNAIRFFAPRQMVDCKAVACVVAVDDVCAFRQEFEF